MSSAERWLRRDKLLGANSSGKNSVTVSGGERERVGAGVNALMESGEGMWSGGEPAHALSELTGRRTNMVSSAGKKYGMNNVNMTHVNTSNTNANTMGGNVNNNGHDLHRTPVMMSHAGAGMGAGMGRYREPGSPQRVFESINERLYEAYNELHSLAQGFHKPFDAPAILVVGHQTDGKSALVEALMGFQFNHVGGGTKTRRPITLHMKYNASCVEPLCFLCGEGGENGRGGGGANDMEEHTLEELQEYIESENRRLESEASDNFWAKEIVVKIEYKYCPNLTIIDTPGLISPQGGNRSKGLQQSARAVEQLVRDKMRQREYIMLCLEDTSDWSNATTRRLVAQVDPEMKRTVVVATKLDTRIPQFSRSDDVELYLRPPARELEPSILGAAPFFTSVPAGRVGNARDAIYRSNDHYREAVAQQELQDVHELQMRLGRQLDPAERSRVGVGQLRRFLEQLLQRRYLDNVPAIVPLLEKEYRNASVKLRATETELGALDQDKLKERGRVFREQLLSKLGLLLRGTVAAPPERFGETLADEHLKGGAFVSGDGAQLPVLPASLPNANMRLFGGAQYHRAMAEFRAAVSSVSCAPINREEIVNACGIDDVHDGVNYTRTACVIAVSKARDAFEPFLHQLGYRLAHVLRRLLSISMHLLQRDGNYLNGHELFLAKINTAWNAFIDEIEKSCRARCLEDLQSTTRYVSWSLHNKSSADLSSLLESVERSRQQNAAESNGNNNSRGASASPSAGGDGSVPVTLTRLLETTLWSRRLGVATEDIVSALVGRIFEGIREHFTTAVELKFNSFFLMPVLDEFPTRLREVLEQAYTDDVDGIFDVGSIRNKLESRQRGLGQELEQVEALRAKFSQLHGIIAQPAPTTTTAAMRSAMSDVSTRAPPSSGISTSIFSAGAENASAYTHKNKSKGVNAMQPGAAWRQPLREV